MSLERLSWAPGAESLRYLVKAGHDRALPPGDRPGDEVGETSPDETFDPLEFVARVVAHIPDPRRHLVHYYGWYANAARAKRWRDAAGPDVAGPEDSERDAAGPAASPMWADEKALRRRWADLFRRIYEVDPLVCPGCGGAMKVIVFVTNRESVKGILRHLEKRRAVAPEAGPGGMDRIIASRPPTSATSRPVVAAEPVRARPTLRLRGPRSSETRRLHALPSIPYEAAGDKLDSPEDEDGPKRSDPVPGEGWSAKSEMKLPILRHLVSSMAPHPIRGTLGSIRSKKRE